jgi:5-methylcytosine-specific restriction endonuclease McrA
MSAESDLRFLRQLQRLLEEGLFTSTYKFALLQAIADLCVERDTEPDDSLRLPIAAIADKIIEYYWRQALPFHAPVGAASAANLLQNTDRQASIIRLLAEARARCDGMLQAARQDDERWSELLREVSRVIRVMPLWKLQTIGRQSCEFLYRRDEYRKYDDTIRLLPGIAAALRNFHGLVTHLVRGAWVDQVRRIPANRLVLGEGATLEEFLFGTDRAALAAYRDILCRHQSRQCFYCGRRVTGAGDLDHFIAWSRYPVDLGHNFVFSHSECNRDKRDYLAHPDHLRRWREQNLDTGEPLSESFSEARLSHDLARTRQVAFWAYEQGEASGTHVWVTGRRLESLMHIWRGYLSGPVVALAADETAKYE